MIVCEICSREERAHQADGRNTPAPLGRKVKGVICGRCEQRELANPPKPKVKARPTLV